MELRPKGEIDLFKALALIETVEEARNFLTDLCTPAEIRTFSERWRVCQCLARGDLSYRQIKDRTGASLTTIGRVARFLNEEKYGGYKVILKKVDRNDATNESTLKVSLF
ncbi:MAG: trp operon repressor [Holosporaceae bacterium]|jgi:TrpR-related protein YerC/YecD|nr:trp operon repressor [Holosporaceae bacterium]